MKWTRVFQVAVVLTVLSAALAWAQDAQPQSQPAASKATAAKPADDKDKYVIGDDDVLAINVWKEPDISRSVPVRPDGKISLPLIGDVQAAGLTPLQLQADLEKKFTSFISAPDVSVIVQEVKSQKINILGEVTRPGSYPLTSGARVLDAIALGGGFKDFAKTKDIYVLRSVAGGKQEKLKFNYKDVIKGKNVEQNVELQAGDTVIVP